MASDRVTIEPLGQTNYRVRSRMMKLYLIASELWEPIEHEGALEGPMIKLDQKALAAIGLRLEACVP